MKQLLAALTSATLFGFLCLVQTVYAISDGNAIGMVHGNLIQGQVFAKSDVGGQRQLTTNAPIYEGDTITTIGEGSVVLLLKDGTIWDIYDESIFAIDKYQFSDDGTDDGANFELHQGQAIYTSGELGERGAAIAIKAGDDTVYPEGTVISFTFVQTVSIIRVVQGRSRIRHRVTQTTRVVTVNQYYIDASSLRAPVVTSSTAVVTTTVARAIQNTPTIKTTEGRSANSIATRIVTKVATATISRSASTTTKTSTTVDVTTTTPGAAGAGAGSGGVGGGGGLIIPFVPPPASPS